MGLFSSKTEIDVDTTVNRVVEDTNVTDTIKSSMIETFLGEDRDLTVDMINDVLNGPALKFHRMHQYGKEEYFYGLPNAWMTSNSGNADALKKVLEEMLDTEVNIEYVKFGFPDITHLARQRLALAYGADFTTNELLFLSRDYGYPVYLKDIQPVYKEVDGSADGLLPVGPPATVGYTPERSVNSGDILTGIGQFSQHTPYVVDETIDEDYAKVTWVYEDDAGEIHEGTINLGMGQYDDKADYFQALATTDIPNARYQFITYQHGSGGVPELDALHIPTYRDPGEYFPFVVFRRQKENRGAEKYHDTEEYKTSVELVSKIGMDYQYISDNIHSSPTIKDVEQAVMMMGVPIHSKDPVEQAYLFEYFYDLYLQGGGSEIWIQDADFKFRLTYENLTFSQKIGTVADPGDYTSFRSQVPSQKWRRVSNALPDGFFGLEWANTTVYSDGMTFRKQASEGIYYEITVANPVIKYDIYKGEYVKGRVGDDVALIPINKTVSDKLPLRHHEHLYLRSLHFVFNSMVKTKTKWYQSDAFKIIMTVITIILTVMTGYDFYTTMALLMAQAGIVAVISAVVIATIKTLIAKAAIEYVAKEAGAEFAFIAAIVGSIYAGYKGFQAGSLANTPYASEMLNASNGLVEAANKVLQDEFKALMDEYREFDLLKSEKMSELDEANELLDSGIDISSSLFIDRKPAVLLGESPTDFFNRSVHAGNIGARSFDALHNYVDISLQLPRTTHQLPGIYA